jgi:hypothetical protein
VGVKDVLNSVLQTRIIVLRLFNGVASAQLVIFNATIAVWPMVALNVTLTAINVLYTCPALSSSDMRDSKSSALCSGDSTGSRYGWMGA